MSRVQKLKNIDAADYVLWRNTLGQTGTGLAADGNGDMVVDQGDYQVWWDNFGQSSAALEQSVSPVPEPAALASLLILAVGGRFLRARR